jgi:hypothetical protein
VARKGRPRRRRTSAVGPAQEPFPFRISGACFLFRKRPRRSSAPPPAATQQEPSTRQKSLHARGVGDFHADPHLPSPRAPLMAQVAARARRRALRKGPPASSSSSPLWGSDDGSVVEERHHSRLLRRQRRDELPGEKAASRRHGK